MKNKILAVCLCVFIFFSMCFPALAAKEEDLPQLTIDFNKRYTDISEYDDVNDPYLDLGEASEEKEQNRNIYVIVLVALLIIAIVVFVRALKKVPDEKSFEDKEKRRLTEKISSTDNKKE